MRDMFIRMETPTSCTEPAIGIGLWNPQFHHRNPWDFLHYTSRNRVTLTAVPTSRNYGGTCHAIG
jgi:hypothetical protein